MLMSDGYTRPERAAEFALARRLLAKIHARRGCPLCVHRVEGWGRSACGLEPAKAFPGCMQDGERGFTLDSTGVRS